MRTGNDWDRVGGFDIYRKRKTNWGGALLAIIVVVILIAALAA